MRPDFTLSYGIRYEGQNRISDHADFGPRFSFAWAVSAGSKPATTVIRGGYGWFFDRFQSTNVLQAIRQNGINQQQYVIKNPAPGVSISAGSLTASEAAPTTYSIAPNLTAPVNMQAAIGIEHRFGKTITHRAPTSIHEGCINCIATTSTPFCLARTTLRPAPAFDRTDKMRILSVPVRRNLSPEPIDHQLQRSRAQAYALWVLCVELCQGRHVGGNLLSFQSI